MILNKEKVSRIGIYFFYDKDGIVDDYVPYLLSDLGKNLSELFIVCNGKLSQEGRQKFERLTSNILVRENIGFDVWAYKDSLDSYGWDRLLNYDEIILMNYTVFGPIYPFQEMFEAMNGRDLDFWGITKHHKVDFDCFGTCKYKYIPEHIQSSFLVIRQSMLRSKEFQSFWDNMPMIHSYGESVGLYEAIFTKEFKEKGFKADTYVNTDDLEGYTRYPLLMMSDELIKNRRCPVLKLKSFSQNYYDIITDTIGNATIDSFEHIQKHTNYNINLIWDNILRTSNMLDIKRLLHLNYIIPQDYIIPNKMESKPKVALIIHIYYQELTDYCLSYAKNMPDYSDLIITTTNIEMKKILEEKARKLNINNIIILLIENRGRDVSSLLVGCKNYVNNYDYVCFMHDKKTTQVKPYANGSSFSYKCWENNLASEDFVQNVITTFELNPRLGLLAPPPPNHGNFYHVIGNEWFSNYENTKELAEKLNLKCDIDLEKEPISPLGTMFWFRPKALKRLFDYNWEYSDFPEEPNGYDGTILHAVERVYGFVVQNEGFYPAWLMSSKLASIEFTNEHFMLQELNRQLFTKYYTPRFDDMIATIKTKFICKWTRGSFKRLLKRLMPYRVWKIMKSIYLWLRGNKNK